MMMDSSDLGELDESHESSEKNEMTVSSRPSEASS